SPSSFNPMRWASVPPIWPAPINAILLRAMVGKLSTCAAAERGRVVVNRLDLARQEAEIREGSVLQLCIHYTSRRSGGSPEASGGKGGAEAKKVRAQVSTILAISTSGPCREPCGRPRYDCERISISRDAVRLNSLAS